jgi:hypothetical protein
MTGERPVCKTMTKKAASKTPGSHDDLILFNPVMDNYLDRLTR